MIGNKTKAPVGEAGAFFLVLFKVRIGSKMAWPLFDLFDLIEERRGSSRGSRRRN